MENINVNEVNTVSDVNEAIDTALVELPIPEKDKPSVVSIVILVFALIGVGSTGYFTYKGVKYLVTKLKDGSVKIVNKDENKKKSNASSKKEVKKSEEPIDDSDIID